MLRIGVCGTGNVARNNYLPFLSRQDDVRLVLYNRTRARAEECAALFDAEVVDSVAALAASAPDAILVLTRETDRFEAAMEILAHRPARLFFEKPLVAREGQAHVSEDDFVAGKKVLETAAAAGCITAMVFNYRFFEQTQKARTLVAEQGFGEVQQITGVVHYACWSHCIDLIHFFAGPVAVVTALQGDVEREGAGIRARDVGAAFVTLRGATGTLIGRTGADFRFPLYELTFWYEGGRVTLRGLDGAMSVADYGRNREYRIELPRDRSRWDQYNASFEKSLAAWLDSVRKGGEPPVPGMAGLQELQFEAGLRRSARLGRPVSLPDEFPLPQ